MAKKLMKAQMGKIVKTAVKTVAKKSAPELSKRASAGVATALYGPAAVGAGIAAYQNKKKSAPDKTIAKKKMGGAFDKYRAKKKK